MSESSERWIGKEDSCKDALDPSLVKRIAATLNTENPTPGESLPHLWHWAFFQIPVPESKTGIDGHIAPGDFLPASDLGTRMWAGGRIEFIEPLKVGVPAERESCILSIKEKSGRSGRLLFVTVKHEYTQAGQLCVSEEQDIVYKMSAAPKLSSDKPVPHAGWSQSIQPTPLFLFRYSAVCFNGHRIHYDYPYTTEVEGYPDLVVHGPLIATLMMKAFVEENPGCRPVRLSYRGVRPLLADKSFQVAGRKTESGKAQLWAANSDGIAHEAEVEFEEIAS